MYVWPKYRKSVKSFTWTPSVALLLCIPQHTHDRGWREGEIRMPCCSLGNRWGSWETPGLRTGDFLSSFLGGRERSLSPRGELQGPRVQIVVYPSQVCVPDTSGRGCSEMSKSRARLSREATQHRALDCSVLWFGTHCLGQKAHLPQAEQGTPGCGAQGGTGEGSVLQKTWGLT